MTPDKVVVDLIGQQTLKTAETVEHKAICCPYSERPSTIADVIQVSGCGVEPFDSSFNKSLKCLKNGFFKRERGTIPSPLY